MAKLIAIEGNDKTTEIVGQALKYALDAIVIDSIAYGKSVNKVVDQLEVLEQVAEQSKVPIVVKGVINSSMTPDARKFLLDELKSRGARAVLVTDDENVSTRSWLREVFGLTVTKKLEYDISQPVPTLIRFVRGE